MNDYKNLNIYILNTLGIGKDSTQFLYRELPIRGLIGLSERSAGDSISDYEYLKKFSASLNTRFIEVNDYSLKSEDDRKKIEILDIDLLLVLGWQRLIPDWLINQCRLGVIGSHGSPYGITGGRGRSPQNWALILGKNEFYISIFKIDSGIDSGKVIDTKKFELTDLDDIKSSYYKVSWLTSLMITKYIKSGLMDDSQLTAQNESEATYLPQRTQDDGLIDWTRKTVEVYNFIRALTKPYPGAKSKFGNSFIKIWRARPFIVEPGDNCFAPGEIVKIFNKDDILVKTGDGFLLIEDYEAFPDQESLKEGLVFESVRFSSQMRQIIDRHNSRYSDLRIAPEILGLLD